MYFLSRLTFILLFSLQCLAIHQTNIHCIAAENENGKPASEKYQKIATEAQLAAGIPLEKHAPIIQDNHDDVIAYIGHAKTHPIVINEKLFNQLAYGVSRSLIFHEAIHVKYDDAKPERYKKDLQHGDPIILRETRADSEGFNNTKCCICLQEMCEFVSKIMGERNITKEQIRRGTGYLSDDEIKQIAQKFHAQCLLCTYHSSLLASGDITFTFNNSFKNIGFFARVKKFLHNKVIRIFLKTEKLLHKKR